MKGTDDILVYRAKCCNPIMGEPIVGYITRGKGVSVHSQNCPNVVNLIYDPDRRIAVEWESGAEGDYEVHLAVVVDDRPGALAAITAVLAAMKTDVRDAEVRTFDDKTASIELTVRINDLKHLDRVVKSVRGVSGVIDVARQAVPRARKRFAPAAPHRVGCSRSLQEVRPAHQVRLDAPRHPRRSAPTPRA